MIISGQMNKLAIIPIFFLTMCAPAPVTPPAQACSPRLDGGLTICPDPDLPLPKPKPIIPRKELKGEIDIYEPTHWYQMQMMFIRNERRKRIEENMTLPSDAINSALDDFMEAQYGSDGSTEQEKLL